jgi:hypothetical protein
VEVCLKAEGGASTLREVTPARTGDLYSLLLRLGGADLGPVLFVPLAVELARAARTVLDVGSRRASRSP